MADGREIIEEVYRIVSEISDGLPALKGSLPSETWSELEWEMQSATKWVGMCRDKVWLRGKQGTDMAQTCLDAARKLQASLHNPSTVLEAAAGLSTELETLARVIASKVQVLT